MRLRGEVIVETMRGMIETWKTLETIPWEMHHKWEPRSVWCLARQTVHTPHLSPCLPVPLQPPETSHCLLTSYKTYETHFARVWQRLPLKILQSGLADVLLTVQRPPRLRLSWDSRRTLGYFGQMSYDPKQIPAKSVMAGLVSWLWDPPLSPHQDSCLLTTDLSNSDLSSPRLMTNKLVSEISHWFHIFSRPITS